MYTSWNTRLGAEKTLVEIQLVTIGDYKLSHFLITGFRETVLFLMLCYLVPFITQIRYRLRLAFG